MNSTWILLFVLVTAVLPTLGCSPQAGDPQVNGISQQLDSLAEDIRAVRSELEAAKSVTKLALSTEEEKIVSELESFANRATEIPPSRVDADKQLERFNSLNESMQPDVQRSNVNRLVALNWNLAAADWLAREAERKLDRKELLIDGKNLVENPLPGASQALLECIKVACERIATDLAKQYQAEVEQKLSDLKTNPHAPVSDEWNKSLADIEEGLSFVDPVARPQMEGQLRSIVERRELARLINEVVAQSNRLGALETESERQVGINQLLQTVLSLRVRFVLEGKGSQFKSELESLAGERNKLENQSKQIEEKLRTEHQRLRTGYQKWALSRIENARRSWNVSAVQNRFSAMLKDVRAGNPATFDALDFPLVREEINTNAGTKITNQKVDITNGEKIRAKYGGWTYDQTKPLSQLAVREAMIRYLLPIETRILDQPISELYHHTWGELWNSLEGAAGDHRLKIAEKSAELTKSTVEDYLEIDKR